MLLDALSISPGDCVAVVGAGGKTWLCWRLTQELVMGGMRVVFTTTTHIRQPAPGAFDRLAIDESIEHIPGFFKKPGMLSLCAAAGIDGDVDDTLLAESLMPAVHTKLRGFAPDRLCELRAAAANSQSPISFLVEADGARGLFLKAPAGHEPAIPACASLVCVVANLDAVGAPLDERTAHRADRVAEVTGAVSGAAITAALIADLLAHPSGGLKGIPGRARRAAILTQADENRPHPDAAFLLPALVERGYDIALNVSLRSPHWDDGLNRIGARGYLRAPPASRR